MTASTPAPIDYGPLRPRQFQYFLRGAATIALLISLGICVAADIFQRFKTERQIHLNQIYSVLIQSLAKSDPHHGLYLKFDFPSTTDTQYGINIFFLAVYWLYPQPVYVSMVPSSVFFPYEFRLHNVKPDKNWLAQHDVGTVITYTRPNESSFFYADIRHVEIPPTPH